MTLRARGPRTLKGAFVTVGSAGAVPQVIGFGYNPATLKRALVPQAAGAEEGERSQAVRFTGAPVQTITIAIEIDACGHLERGDPVARALGALPELAALELLTYPSLDQINQSQAQLAQGVMEISPQTAPRTLFVWGAKRVLPVRITSYDITEELFDSQLNPIRATVTIAMRVLTYADLDPSNRQYFEFMTYHQNLISAASQQASATPAIGVTPTTL